MTTPGWALEVTRDDLTRTTLLELEVPEPAPGEAVLRVDRVGLTANNVTYAVLGEAFRYWEFFPASKPSRGRVPLWGFAEVVASRAEGVRVGQRVYGYLPTASHLVVTPARPDAQGFRDASEHRRALPPAYNAYSFTTGDPAYEADREDLQVLYRPLFLTSFMLADALGEQDAEVLVLSSASSKTAYGTAFLLQGGRAELVGLTSPGNLAFTTSLGCYDRVLTYDQVSELGRRPTAYVDLAGSTPLRAPCTTTSRSAWCSTSSSVSPIRTRLPPALWPALDRPSSSPPTGSRSARATGAEPGSRSGSGRRGAGSRRPSRAGST